VSRAIGLPSEQDRQYASTLVAVKYAKWAFLAAIAIGIPSLIVAIGSLVAALIPLLKWRRSLLAHPRFHPAWHEGEEWDFGVSLRLFAVGFFGV